MLLRMSVLSVMCAVAFVAPPDAAVRGNGQETSQEVRVPHEIRVAGTLARQGFTAGVVICGPPWNRTTEPVEIRGTDSRPSSTCEELNATLVHTRERGVLHVRSTREPAAIRELLNRPIRIEGVSDVPAIDAVTLTIVQAVRGLGSVPSSGYAGNGPLSQRVTLEGGSTTFMAALDDVVRQTSSLVWYVTFSPEGVPISVGLHGPGVGAGGSIFPGSASRP